MKLFSKNKRLFQETRADAVKRALIGQSSIEVGRFSYGYENLTVREWGEGAKLSIGAFCSIADEITVFLGGNHRTDWATTFPFGHVFQDELGGEHISGNPTTNGDVVIGSDVWLGGHVTIMSGITIGDGAVIAANSVVVKDVGPYEIWGGNPAKPLNTRFAADVVAELLDLRWWDLDSQTVQKIAPLLSQTPTLDVIAEIKTVIAS